MWEKLHEVSGFLGLAFLLCSIVLGAIAFYKFQRLFPFVRPKYFVRAHKLFVGLFITALLAHILTTTYTNWFFIIGATLLGLTMVLAYLVGFYPNRRTLIIYLKLFVLTLGLGTLFYAHQTVEEKHTYQGITQENPIWEEEHEEEHEED
ncbi:MAG: hypothetical protein GXN97_03075 [Aquificae bacterium]|nr:hypothetical protein [Aquificota bacterium]